MEWHVLGHSISLTTIIGSLLGLLPAVAAIMPIIYYSILIYKELTKK